MSGNTAIFYDIENLLKGHNLSTSSISLKSIFQEVERLEIVKRILVQKAYADWSNPGLSIMKREINELGIDPIQVFGFSYYKKKNAADIQLAVDSIDLAYARTSIDIFVIVSGDGGFSAVAKKLHEYGKYVVGCGYESSTNKVLESVCDYFITIDDPEDLEEEKSESEQTFKITNPMIAPMSQSLERLVSNDRNAIIEKSRSIINWLVKDHKTSKKLSSSGLDLPQVQEAFQYGIEDFKPFKIGLPKFKQFLQYICRNTDLQVFTLAGTTTDKIAFKNAKIKGLEPLHYLDDNYLHSPENYKSILAIGKPRLKNIDLGDFYNITSLVASLKGETHTLNSILEKINTSYPGIESSDVNQYLFCLEYLEIFDMPEKEKTLSEQQYFNLKTEYFDNEKIIETFKDSVVKKLSSFCGEDLKQDVVQQLINFG